MTAFDVRGVKVIVDEEDVEILKQHRWVIGGPGYAVTYKYPTGKTVCLLMHRLIVGARPGQVCDHINGNKLDNRKSNLRICKQRENAKNRVGCRDSRSGIKGVHWDKSRGLWGVQIRADERRIYVGRYSDIEQAKAAYNEAAAKYHGAFARLNP